MWLIAALLAGFAPAVLAGDVSKQKVECEGASYEYLLFAQGSGQQPAMLLLHGAGGTPDPMIDAWKKFAKKNGITLIAPAVPRDIKFEPVAPAVFHCIVSDAEKHASIDAKKVYLFGYSMGGYLAFDAAMFDSESYAGIAVYANGITDDYASIVDRAKRKIPVTLYVGANDKVYPIAQVRKTRELLEKHGYTVQYLELKGEDHNYFATADRVNEDTWKFFLGHPVADKP